MDGVQSVTEQPAVRSAVVVGIWSVVGVLAILGGVGVLVGSVVGDSVPSVPVSVATSAQFGGVQPCAEDDATLDTGECEPPDGWHEDWLMISMPHDGLMRSAFGAPRTAWVLARAPVWLGLLGGGAAVLVLVPVIRTLSQGRPFAHGNAARLASGAGIVAATWAAGTAAWYLAARQVVGWLEQLGVAGGGLGEDWISAQPRTVFWPLIIVAMLATLAAATRRGAALAAETDGLV